MQISSPKRSRSSIQLDVIGAPTSTEAGETAANHAELDSCPNFEAEAQALVLQVQESLQESIAAVSADKAVELMSEDEEDETDRKNKRPRSMEPFAGGQQHGLGGPTSSPKQ